jgi:hypothetical protein
MRSPATAIASVFSRIFSAPSLRANLFKQTALFGAAALFVWLLSMSYGVDLSAGFF